MRRRPPPQGSPRPGARRRQGAMVKNLAIAGSIAAVAVAGLVVLSNLSSDPPPAEKKAPRSSAARPAKEPVRAPEPPPRPAIRIDAARPPEAQPPPAPQPDPVPPVAPPPAPPAPPPPEPAAPRVEPAAVRSVREALEAGREAALGRVKAAREEIARDAQELRDREARLEKALRDYTERQPLRLKLSESLVIDQVKVASYAGGRVKLVWPQGTVEYPIDLLPPDLRDPLLEGALHRAPPRDQLEIAKLLLKTGDLDRAAKCVAKAAAADPSLKPICPDIDRVRKMSRVFEGAFTILGNQLNLSWTFRRKDEAKDFVPEEDSACAVLPDVGLEVTGKGLAFASVKEVPFRDRVRVSIMPREADATAHILGVQFRRPDGVQVVIFAAMATKYRVFLVRRREEGKVTELLPATSYTGVHRMEMEFSRGRFSFRIGGRQLWSGKEGGFTDVAVVVGGVGLSKSEKPEPPGKVTAAFREIAVSGGVNPAWMRKKLADYREALVSELNREQRIRRKEDKDREASLALSVDAGLAHADPAARGAYDQALALVRKYMKSREEADHAAAAKAVDELLSGHSELAPAWYWRGVLHEDADGLKEAARNYDQAIARLPEFPEALASRSLLHAMAGDERAARTLLDRALAIKPDLAEAHLLLGRLEREGGRREAALEAAALARKLSPLDPQLQAHAQMLANAVRGPAWERASRHETTHYILRSDLPAAKCRAYAEHLEALRGLYEEALGLKNDAARPVEVLIFNAQEGYYGYMDVTSGRRQEHTLGMFSPWYGQLVLYEDAEQEETLRVLGHEGFHQYLHGVLPEAPIWFNEGMAEYVGASRVEKGKVAERGRIQEGRLDDLKAALKYGWKPVPFGQILVESQASFYAKDAPFKYAQAWSMIHFFLHAQNGRWKDLLAAYISRLAAGDAPADASRATFGKENLKEMEEAWLRYVKELSPPRPK